MSPSSCRAGVLARLHLAGVMDLCTRRIVGWSMADHMRTDLVADALQMAITRRGPDAGLLHHSDRGVQYASDDYQHAPTIRGEAHVLAAELVVRAKTRNEAGFRYGAYRVWGDLKRSRYFRVEGQADQEAVLRAVSGRHEALLLGRAFQGKAAVRELSAEGHAMLAAAARDLETEPRARLLPEDALEAQVLLGDPAGVLRLIQKEEPGIAEERRRYLYGTSVSKNPQLSAELQGIYEGKCQLCLWDPRAEYGEAICEAHHIVWLSRGGEDALGNLALLCPNHHRAVHRTDAPLDFGDMAFDFGGHREGLRVNRHLGMAGAAGEL